LNHKTRSQYSTSSGGNNTNDENDPNLANLTNDLSKTKTISNEKLAPVISARSSNQKEMKPPMSSRAHQNA
jgi:hypothetical protein